MLSALGGTERQVLGVILIALGFFPPCPLHPRLPPTGTFCPSVQRGTDPGRGGERNCPESKPLIPLRGWTSWAFRPLLLGVVWCSSGKDSGSGHPDMGLNPSPAMPQQTSSPAPVSLGAQGQSAHPGACHQEDQRPCIPCLLWGLLPREHPDHHPTLSFPTLGASEPCPLCGCGWAECQSQSPNHAQQLN